MLHGGDIYNNIVELDFSINVNPLGIHPELALEMKKSIASCDKYPDISCTYLRNALANKLCIDEASITVGNGASELLMAITHAIRPEKIILTSPSFVGYRHVAQAVGAKIIYSSLEEKDDFELTCDRISDSISNAQKGMLILTNPNNPSGRIIESKQLDEIIELCNSNNIIPVIDECFMRLSGMEKTNSLLESNRLSSGLYDKVIVISAFTKTYAIPGIRLGYMVCTDKQINSSVRMQLPEWNVSLVAQSCGIAALKLDKYLEKAQELIAKERAFLEKSLGDIGFVTFPSDANYILIKTDSNIDFYNELLARKILIRKCDDYSGLGQGYYRIAVKKHEENQLLIDKLMEIIES